MNKWAILILMVVTVNNQLTAQVKINKKNKLFNHFHSYNTIQLLNGRTTSAFAVNSVNGFQFGKFFTGIGTGFDYYYHTSVPLFVEARFDLAKPKGKFQLFANGGFNFPFAAQNKKFEFKKGPYKTGGFYSTGIDYLIPVKNEAVILGAAFNNKQVIQMVDNYVWNPVLNRSENISIKEQYSLNRIAIRIGWMF